MKVGNRIAEVFTDIDGELQVRTVSRQSSGSATGMLSVTSITVVTTVQYAVGSRGVVVFQSTGVARHGFAGDNNQIASSVVGERRAQSERLPARGGGACEVGG